MAKIHFLFALLILTILVSTWQEGKIPQIPQWDIAYISEAVILALIIETAAIMVEFKGSFSDNYMPDFIHKIIKYIRSIHFRCRIDKTYNKENRKEVFEQMVLVAIENLRGNDISQKKNALAQVFELERDTYSTLACKIFILNALFDAHHHESDNKFKMNLREAICHFYKRIK